MLQLEQETRTVYHLHYASREMHALERQVEKIYGRQFEFILDCANDSTEVYEVEPVDITEADEDDREYFMRWVDDGGDETYLMGDLLNDLCFRKLIPAGYYIYHISW